MESSPKIKLQLFIDRKAEKVIFAEVGKDFVDFLFYLVSLPVTTVFSLLKEKTTVGSFSHICESIENLSHDYLQPDQNKNSLLNPKAPIYASGISLMLADHDLANRKLYNCPNHWCVTDVPNLLCRTCNGKMKCEAIFVLPSASNTVENGFVKGLIITYIVMDNLEFVPASAKNVVTLLNKLNVKDLSELEEIVVDLGVEEGLKLLKLSLECKTVLTSFYMENVQLKV
ncbi:hypothetical protein LWI28_028426 [Acer negundo]|uniref:Uncharacterized protein n=1 Tax=Acer negundo TaxID=4023 RepID=A0AAD5ICA8_ACENE|nr:hypothetical protein LWI28_018517 [Acer negundo]KAI9157812.1 hypothetical protein LWI28_028426 [Acer negundo]